MMAFRERNPYVIGITSVLVLAALTGLAFSVVRRARQAVWVVVGLVVLLGMRLADRKGAVATLPRS